ncbi:MAG TPA: LysM peptidoglycan-binding domain-containing protein [Anaerolineales bacterium]|jgi:murein DD-endopeptidase MepM/ murein hydrolase activator NlpD
MSRFYRELLPVPGQRLGLILALVALLSACAVPEAATPNPTPASPPTPVFPTPAAVFTALPARPLFGPGELVDYTAQTGDTLPALAAHFNTSIAEIRTANPIIPQTVSSMPPGLPMKIPIYYLPLWGTPYQIIPDSLFVDGPAQLDFDLQAFIQSQPGWFKNYQEQLGDGPHSGAEIVRLVSDNFSISPRLLLALLEYYAQALSNPKQPDTTYVLGNFDQFHQGVYLQLVWMANTLNNGYYGWRRGSLTEFEHPDKRIERPDPWQNAASVALQYAFSQLYSSPIFDQMVGPGGLAETYAKLYGDPWAKVTPHIPGSLTQPDFVLPFEPGKGWNYTGGPHTGWGKGEPYAAIDFAPNGVSACGDSADWVTAVADGVVARSDFGELMLDLDGDGKEQTGWVIFYLHLGTEDRAPTGKKLKAGDRLGHPSCEGGETTGTHVHIARKYNGEWMLADSPLPFNMEGWVVRDGADAYHGTMVRFSQTVTASDKSEGKSYIKSERK